MARPAGLIVGPARYVLNSQSFYSADDVTININEETVPHVVRGMELDRMITDATVQLSVKPDGQVTAGLVSALWPYLTAYPGQSINPLSEIDCLDGKQNPHLRRELDHPQNTFINAKGSTGVPFI